MFSCNNSVQKSKPNIGIMLEELIFDDFVYAHAK